MDFLRHILIPIFLLALTGCGQEPMPETPLGTLQAYTSARKKKDVARMKLFLSEGSVKMAEEEAKAQGKTLDEVLLNETLIAEGQREVKFKPEKIDGETARIEIQNSFGGWDVVPFIKEGGAWKIAKEKFADEMQRQMDEDMKRLDQKFDDAFQAIPTPGDLDDMATPPPVAP